jgi:hypothetical protein
VHLYLFTDWLAVGGRPRASRSPVYPKMETPESNNDEGVEWVERWALRSAQAPFSIPAVARDLYSTPGVAPDLHSAARRKWVVSTPVRE